MCAQMDDGHFFPQIELLEDFFHGHSNATFFLTFCSMENNGTIIFLIFLHERMVPIWVNASGSLILQEVLLTRGEVTQRSLVIGIADMSRE